MTQETINQIAERFCASHKSCKVCSYGMGNELGVDRCLVKQLSMITYPFENITHFLKEWAINNPLIKPKTYAQDFLEKFPNAKTERLRSGDVIPAVCWFKIYGAFTNLNPIWCATEQCIRCWKTPMPEQGEENKNDA